MTTKNCTKLTWIGFRRTISRFKKWMLRFSNLREKSRGRRTNAVLESDTVPRRGLVLKSDLKKSSFEN